MLVVYVVGFMLLAPGPVSTFLKKVIVYYSELCVQYEYSQPSLRRTPLGPALSTRIREVSVLLGYLKDSNAAARSVDTGIS